MSFIQRATSTSGFAIKLAPWCLLFAAACGGNVILPNSSDEGSGGAGGATTTSSMSGGGGSESECTSDADCPLPANACIGFKCDGGVCRQDDAAVGAPCASSAGTVCDGAGECVACLQARDCLPGETCDAAHTCQAPSCFDGLINGDETDVDCGGSCPTCPAGASCLVNADCISDACDASSHCVDARCDDGQSNGDETDVDCGGSCAPCAAALHCLVDGDCQSEACDAGLCAKDRCSDGRQDGDETDVDCGGSCARCSDGAHCSGDPDCASDACDQLRFVCLPVGCNDGVKDGLETDVDCGGGVCAGCDSNMACLTNADCATSQCSPTEHTCVGNSCADHRQDGFESDIDCGGGECDPCAVGKKCLSGFDCQGGHICATGFPRVCR